METECTLAPGDDGVANNTAETAPKGAIVIEIPLVAKNWSIFPRIAIAANAPDLITKKIWTINNNNLLNLQHKRCIQSTKSMT